MKIIRVDFHDVDCTVIFNVKNLDESKMKDVQIEYLKNKDNKDVTNKLINIFRELNDSRFNDYSDEDVLDTIIETIESDEFLYEYVKA